MASPETGRATALVFLGPCYLANALQCILASCDATHETIYKKYRNLQESGTSKKFGLAEVGDQGPLALASCEGSGCRGLPRVS